MSDLNLENNGERESADKTEDETPVSEQATAQENTASLRSPYDKSNDEENIADKADGNLNIRITESNPQSESSQPRTTQTNGETHNPNPQYNPMYSPYEQANQRQYTSATYADGGNPYENTQPNGTYYGAYGYTQDYTGGANFGNKPPKKPMSKPLKAFLGTVAVLCVAFLVAFVAENVRAYEETGGFNIDSFLDDYSYNYAFGTDTDIYGFGGSGDDSDVWSDIDTSSDDDSDAISTEVDNDIVAAPDSDTVVNADAQIITAADQPTDLDSGDYTAQKAYKAIENSVVGIVTYENDVGLEDEATGEGSGIIITEDGYVVTNSHVISDTKDIAVEVILNDDTSYVAAIVGYDSRTDIAVLKIDATGLTPVTFVDSDQVEVGQDALAVGNPGGIEYSNSLTRGTVSAVNRVVSSSSMVTYIQTDAAINPGNSGGPLMNIAGQVMGINTIKIVDTQYEGMGFAIPSNTVIEIANDLMTQGYVSGRVRIGITGEAISSYMAALYNVPEGIMIDSFADDSPFVGTDAQEGDIITAIDGEEVTSFSDIYALMENYSPGDTATVTLYRSSSGETIQVEIVLAEDKGETQQ